MATTASPKTSYLLMASGLIEVGAGLGLALAPGVLMTLFFGGGGETTTGLTVARLAGAALLALGTACWLARHNEGSQAARAIIVAMLVYNTAAVAVLASAAIVLELQGPGLWPVVLLHGALAVWCIARLWAFQPLRTPDPT
jgi:hypothetical protein